MYAKKAAAHESVGEVAHAVEALRFRLRSARNAMPFDPTRSPLRTIAELGFPLRIAGPSQALGSLGWALTFCVCALSCVLALEPKNGRAYLRRAMTYQRAGRCVPYIAISTARCSAEAQKGFAAHPIAWHVRVPARCYSSFRPAEALEDLDTAVDVTPPSGRDEALS